MINQLLYQTGCYRVLFEVWRPTINYLALELRESEPEAIAAEDIRDYGSFNFNDWVGGIYRVAKEWAKVATVSNENTSAFVLATRNKKSAELSMLVDWWEYIRINSVDITLAQLRHCVDQWNYKESETLGKNEISDILTKRSEIARTRRLLVALINLCAAADEACAGVGFETEEGSELILQCGFFLTYPTTRPTSICSDTIDHTRIIVLPKGRTAQVGATIRSASHNLALCQSNEISPKWICLPNALVSEKSPIGYKRAMSVVVIPWPFILSADGIEPVPLMDCPAGLAEPYGFFRYTPPRFAPECAGVEIAAIVDRAKAKCHGDIDIVVFPELAVHYEDASALVEFVKNRGVKLVVFGAGTPADAKEFGTNCAVVAWGGGDDSIVQHKHHRWLVEGRQIYDNGLMDRLHPGTRWWESHGIKNRDLNFIAFPNLGMAVSVLICEDLARQDLVTDYIRRVGPSLVLALLMDGPQIKERWSARYAMALADDPGSSVLTLTSLGMIRSSPHYNPAGESVIGLWAEQGKSSELIKLNHDKRAVLLNLDFNHVTEYACDGRMDDGNAIRLSLIHQTQI